jgi:hypothetical protein
VGPGPWAAAPSSGWLAGSSIGQIPTPRTATRTMVRGADEFPSSGEPSQHHRRGPWQTPGQREFGEPLGYPAEVALR